VHESLSLSVRNCSLALIMMVFFPSILITRRSYWRPFLLLSWRFFQDAPHPQIPYHQTVFDGHKLRHDSDLSSPTSPLFAANSR